MSVIQRIADARREFIRGCGFEPYRIVMTAEEARAILEWSYPHAGDHIFGMRIEIGDRLHCRADRLAA